jgi:hypothetical protein
MNWKGFEKKRSWPNLRRYLCFGIMVLRKTTKNIIKDKRSVNRYLNPGPPEYEIGILATQPRRSLTLKARKTNIETTSLRHQLHSTVVIELTWALIWPYTGAGRTVALQSRLHHTDSCRGSIDKMLRKEMCSKRLCVLLFSKL